MFWTDPTARRLPKHPHYYSIEVHVSAVLAIFRGPMPGKRSFLYGVLPIDRIVVRADTALSELRFVHEASP